MATRFVNHTADVQFIVSASSKRKVFEACVKAFTSYVAEGRAISSKEKRTVYLQGVDDASLLYGLIDELVYLVDSEQFLVSAAKILFEKKGIRATLFGKTLDSPRGYRHVKAATYAEMYVRKKKSFWEAQVVLDV